MVTSVCNPMLMKLMFALQVFIQVVCIRFNVLGILGITVRQSVSNLTYCYILSVRLSNVSLTWANFVKNLIQTCLVSITAALGLLLWRINNCKLFLKQLNWFYFYGNNLLYCSMTAELGLLLWGINSCVLFL